MHDGRDPDDEIFSHSNGMRKTFLNSKMTISMKKQQVVIILCTISLFLWLYPRNAQHAYSPHHTYYAAYCCFLKHSVRMITVFLG
jgi:hypothetical protein